MKPSKKLRVYWSKKEKELMYYYPKYAATGGMLAWHFENLKCDGKTLVEELEDRGFDLSTLRFSIAYKEGNEPK